MRVLRATLLSFGLMLASASAHPGVFELDKDCQTEGAKCGFSFVGEIEADDVRRFQQILMDAGRRANTLTAITLESPGGDVGAALALGRLVRKHHLWTITHSECLSSCVIVLAGGIQRLVMIDLMGVPIGKVGIHRPYTEQLGTSFEKHQATSKELGNQVRAFLREGGVSEQLWDDMLKIEPESMKLLTQDEAVAYGLAGTDPAWADYQDAKDAERYGISKQELLNRRRLSDALCRSDPVVMADQSGAKFGKCIEDVLTGRRR